MITPSSQPLLGLRTGILIMLLGVSIALSIAFSGLPAIAETVAVRYPEGTSHGYVRLVDRHHEMVAQGELVQTVRGHEVASRLVFHFLDGSVHDERVTFSQDRIFTLRTYELKQRGPSFPEPLDISLDQSSGHYTVRTGPEKEGRTLEGRLALPTDTYNGMLVMLMKNLPRKESAKVHLVVFTPEPKLVQVKVTSVREETVKIGLLPRKARQYAIEPQLATLTQFFGRLFGMLPHYSTWILTDEVPSFLQFEGPLFLKGPIWRIELFNPLLPPSLDGVRH